VSGQDASEFAAQLKGDLAELLPDRTVEAWAEGPTRVMWEAVPDGWPDAGEKLSGSVRLPMRLEERQRMLVEILRRSDEPHTTVDDMQTRTGVRLAPREDARSFADRFPTT
jgi:hypothetical protein